MTAHVTLLHVPLTPGLHILSAWSALFGRAAVGMGAAPGTGVDMPTANGDPDLTGSPAAPRAKARRRQPAAHQESFY